MTQKTQDTKEKESKKSKVDTTAKPKRRNYKKELEQALVEKNNLQEKLLRTAAEFDNYRKRSINEKAELRKYAHAEMIVNLLPVVDDLDRFITAEKKNIDYDALHKGIIMVYKKFMKILEDQGLVSMKTIGESFDPEKHDALMQVEKEDVDSNIIIEEHLKGYELDDRVLRHAKVIVSK